MYGLVMTQRLCQGSLKNKPIELIKISPKATVLESKGEASSQSAHVEIAK